MTELSYDRRGSGPPLVLIHGLGSHRQVWTPILAGLATGRDVIALDLPGFGGSPLWAPAPHAGSVPHLADQVESFLDRLGIANPEVAGSSLGGGIALELGRRGRASAVTAFAPVGFWSGAGRRWSQTVVTAARVAAGRLDARLPRIMASTTGRSAFCALFYARPHRLDPGDAVAAARALATAPGFTAARDAFADLTPWRYERTSHPVTIAWGTRDAVLPFPQSRRARTLLPGARHVTLPGCGHLPFADDPQACLAVLNGGAR
ncbi:alpha/beta fold hydrolase [Actinoplanes xinjiangensis]|uniref:Pimeloyl-ACP methyl ester carboxylesterase n=1 Tax=Actinoplanes xinjiangensis TaxID=512350 RepID=A0A316FVP0_9ACTN|nr:alpha/beta fold hydrolase [Actinoplanes xinjiangensis]PWK52669.1 pimeloyl-ACP methyl ester carboxylesterase [Actinoplanes xinjiangensis]GIF36635.1 hydrolase [Actinoplanes xinjiangensis]